MKSLVNSMEKGMLRQIINRTLKSPKRDREKNLMENQRCAKGIELEIHKLQCRA